MTIQISEKVTKNMSYTRKDALKLINEIKIEYADRNTFLHNANEATTRLLIIDGVLEALGWDKVDFNPETYARETGYLDYLLSIDNVPRFIVEAKRTGVTFNSSSKNIPRTNYQLRYFRTAFGQPFSRIVTQAEKYAHETGVKYALITNGSEWALLQLLLAPGYTDLNDLRGYYFGNIFTDNFNFELFWNILYKPYVDSGSLESSFADINIKEADFVEIPSAKIGQLRWQKGGVDSILRDFYSFFFDEITDKARRNMLEKCFVADSRLNQFRGELNRALKDAAPTFVPEAEDIDPGEGERLVTQISGDQKGKVVIVTGSVGCGKTTFVTKELVRARHEQKDKILALKIDLRDEVENQYTDVKSDLWKYIDEQWRKARPDAYHNETLRKIFGRELSDLRKGPDERVFDQDELELARQEASELKRLLNDPEIYFKKCWRYYRRKEIGVVVFLDNVDRRSKLYQEQVYNFTHKLARETGATVIVTMRELTFFRGREAGFLDVRSDTVFHLKSPNLEQLISRRLTYIEQHIEQDHRLSTWKKTRDWESFYQGLLIHARYLKRVFLVDGQGRDILALLGSVAWHDVRFFLITLKQLHFLLGSNQSNWSKSEVIAALMTPIDRGQPILGNLYQPTYSAYQNYFLKIRVLLLMQHGQLQHATRYGTTLNSIVRFLRQYGYQERWIKSAMQELVQQRFLECLEVPVAEEFTKNYQLQNDHSFRPSPLAYECTESTIIDSNYLALIGNDLPFHQEYSYKKYEEIIKGFSEVLMNEGLTRTAIELLDETHASRIIAKYLVEMLKNEQPSESLAKYMPEIAGTEKRMEEIAVILRQKAQLPALPKSTPRQRSLFDSIETDLDQSTNTHKLRIPKTMSSAKIGKSGYAPLIFWALVYLRLNGNLGASGVEITKVINKYLVDDNNPKASNNVSRALRNFGESQEWLISRKVSARLKVFQVKQNWTEYWEAIFGEPAPEIDKNAN